MSWGVDSFSAVYGKARSSWEAVLAEELRQLSPELAKVDALLDEGRFLGFRRRLTRDDWGSNAAVCCSDQAVPRNPASGWLPPARIAAPGNSPFPVEVNP